MKHVLISIILSFLLAFIAYIKEAMTYPALILAFTFAFLITYLGGVSSFLMLATVFLLTVIAGKIRAKKRDAIAKEIHKKGHKKDVSSIIANVLPGTIVLIIYGITKNEYFLVIYAALMAEAISDSLASDIGMLSDKDPINILTFKRSPAGLSGNISLLGAAASLFGSVTIALIYYLFNANFTHFFIITLCGFLGNFIDSFLGALLQIKYKCPVCGIITEKEEHCSQKTIYSSGVKLFNNDIVNILTNVLSGTLAYILLLIMG